MKVSVLLVGESPPASGKFFYVRSPMTGFTVEAFKKAHGSCVPSKDQEEFLRYFKGCGCFLDDICHFPVDKLPKDIRERRLAEAVSEFAKRLARMRPDAIAVVLKKIEPHARIAAAQAKLDVPIYVLPFAGHGHQGKYVKALAKVIRKHVPPGT